MFEIDVVKSSGIASVILLAIGTKALKRDI